MMAGKMPAIGKLQASKAKRTRTETPHETAWRIAPQATAKPQARAASAVHNEGSWP